MFLNERLPSRGSVLCDSAIVITGTSALSACWGNYRSVQRKKKERKEERKNKRKERIARTRTRRSMHELHTDGAVITLIGELRSLIHTYIHVDKMHPMILLSFLLSFL